jgi:hypothetical protein
MGWDIGFNRCNHSLFMQRCQAGPYMRQLRLYCNQELPFICNSRVLGNDKNLNEKKSELADCRHIAFCQKMLK